ncbi:helix-turn-helix domain-containing protein [Flagellimonas eckloniae]|uniref:HTH araC/xylS-type domain-containing protein n=1 Tax=Flagellimonas eckloniae TaxID=346185 RepID=A0A0Q1DMX3_9FLAO|nr:helix-turn-helix domain-containing protein [Allomuricauda eckloniae]KQC30370.1 hypothetical protein AAY42_11155 [Allomuricauda eckloniae]
MIKSFAEKVDCEIPEKLQPHLVMAIHGSTENKVDLTIPIFPTGFPVIINVYGAMPDLFLPEGYTPAVSRLNLAGQIFNHNPNIRVNGYFGQIGFLLHPMAPYYLFHKLGDFSLNRWVPFDKTSPMDTSKLEKELNNCADPLGRFPIIIKYLEALVENRLPPISWLDKAFETIYAKNGQVSLNHLSEQIGISLRHFRRKFKEIIGVPPKFFCKVIQLNTIFEAINSPQGEKLLNLALDHGYYDQSHFINDFKRLIGNSPEKFLESEHVYTKTYMGRKGI